MSPEQLELRRAKNREYQRRYRATHLDQAREAARNWHQKQRTEMIAAYGGRCACCGETEPTFLSLDHVNGGGTKARRAAGGQVSYMRRLQLAGWPQEGYRLLCMNCQFGWLSGRTCPHAEVV